MRQGRNEIGNTDLQKFIDLYASFGIDLKEFEESGFIKIRLDQKYSDVKEGSKSIKFVGYGSSFSTIIFSKKGKFLRQGFWE